MGRLVILGGGESGTGAAVLAKKKGFDVFVSDKGRIKQNYKDVLLHHEIEWEEEKHSEMLLIDADEAVKSPGIPDDAAIVQKLKDKGIKVISEIEFAARYTRACLIGITGTNGKTTTASLTYHILKSAGCDVCLAGNVGNSFAMALAERDYDYFVLELSSFQLDGMYDTKLDTTVLLNITPDHLDRYDSMKAYIASKLRILQNQTSDGLFIYNADDAETTQAINSLKIIPEALPYSVERTLTKGAYLDNNEIVIQYKTKLTMKIEEIAIAGKHNTGNSMAAALIAQRHKIRNNRIRECMGDYVNVEHRMEFVARIRGAEFINDSKATNVNSAWYALGYYNTPIIWIAGGIDKGNDYSKIKDTVKGKVKALICLGTDNSKLIEALKDNVAAIYETQDMAAAVELSYSLSEPGYTVLLSPACASFDLFDNYEDRGNLFKEAVKNL